MQRWTFDRAWQPSSPGDGDCHGVHVRQGDNSLLEVAIIPSTAVRPNAAPPNEDLVSPRSKTGEVTKLTDVSHPANSTLTVAWATHSRIKAFGLEFSNDGRTGTPHRFPGRHDLGDRAVLLIGQAQG
jgi:hypothetical protein